MDSRRPIAVEDALAPPGGSLAEATIAVVGAGGKKTTMYSLAGRLDRAVVTASVRIPIFDPHVASVAVTSDPRAVLGDADPSDFPLGLVPARERDDRYLGYDVDVVDDIATAHDGPVLIKADGARMREFKAPGDDEPQIPDSTDVVVPVASVHAVGEPLTDEVVHRPERVAAVARDAGFAVDVGDEITPDVVAAVLTSDAGALKDVPAGVSVVPLLNKVDDAHDETVARDVVSSMRSLMWRESSGSTHSPESTDSTVADAVSIPETPESAADGPTNASCTPDLPTVVLAQLAEERVVDVVDR